MNLTMADGTIKFDTELDTSGLVSGLGELSDESKEAMGSLAEAVNSELARAFAELAGSAAAKANEITSDAIAAEKLYERESERIQNSKKNAEALYLDRLKDNVDRIKALRDEELRALKVSYDLGLISTQEYFANLADFRDRYFEYGSASWISYTAEILKHNKKLSDQQQEALENAAETMEQSIRQRFDALIKEQERLKEKLADYGRLSNSNTIIGENIKFTTLADINAQNEALEEYARLLCEVRDRVNDYWRTDTQDAARNEQNMKLRSDYLSQLRGMSVEDASDYARVLLGVTDEKLSDYLGAYERKQEIADRISAELFSSDAADAADSAARRLGSEFNRALAEELSDLSGSFFTSGEEACKSFGEGFLSGIDQVMAQLSRSIAEGAAKVTAGTTVENNTSYNLYGVTSPEQTIRGLRQYDELHAMLTQ